MSRLVEQSHPRAVARAAWPAQHAGSAGVLRAVDGGGGGVVPGVAEGETPGEAVRVQALTDAKGG